MNKEVQYFLECAHKCAEAGLLSCSSGNLSLRCKGQDNEDCALLSATGSWLGELREDQVALCHISDGTPLNGVHPTMEAGFHLGTMRKRPEVACGPDFPDTFRRAVFFEMACRIIVLSRGNYTTV